MELGEALIPYLREIAIDAKTSLLAAVEAERDRVLNETKARSSILPVWVMAIDGVANAPLSDLKPESEVVILWSYLPEVVRDTRLRLLANAPEFRGKYKASVATFIDDENTEGDVPEQAITAETLKVVIVPTVPYARRLEVGKDKHGNPFVKQVDPHIVERTAIQQRSLFGKIANIEFGYADLSTAWELSMAGRIPRHFEGGMWKYRKSPRTRNGMQETHVRYPAITITPKWA